MMMIISSGRASGEDGVSRLMLREHIFRRDEYFCVDDDERPKEKSLQKSIERFGSNIIHVEGLIRNT